MDRFRGRPSAKSESNTSASHSNQQSGNRLTGSSQELVMQLQQELGNQAVLQMLGTHSSVTMQRKLRIGSEEEFDEYTDPEQVRNLVMDEAGSSALSMERLVELAKDKKVHSFPDWVTAIHVAEGNGLSTAQQLADMRYVSLITEAREIMNTIQFPEKFDVKLFKNLFKQLDLMRTDGAVDEEDVLKLVADIEATIKPLQIEMFRMDEGRTNVMPDSEREVDSGGKFGYHVSKLHNIPGIRAAGLDPNMGASDKGSVAMSTEDQVKGSKQTSENVVAFGLKPSTFRPYVNQYEDRRQMIEGTPYELKPVMLRFQIELAVGWDNMQYAI